MSGVEIEGVIVDASAAVLKVKVKRAALKVSATTKRKRRA
jgi:hypothetical protein